jgi:hypothetical protein
MVLATLMSYFLRLMAEKKKEREREKACQPKEDSEKKEHHVRLKRSRSIS